MIGYLPPLYDDELFSGYLMRLFEQLPYFYPKNFVNDIFVNKKERFNYIYINKLKPEFIELLDKTFGYKNILDKHTILGLDNLFGNHHSVSASKRFIRYCPLCTNEMAEKHIQVLPQIQELKYCPIHGIEYLNSNILLNRNINYRVRSILDFDTSNVGIPKRIDLNDVNVKIGQYISEILKVPKIDYKQAKIRDYIPLGYFTSKTGTKINIDKLKKDLDEFYIGLDNNVLTKRSLKAVLLGESSNPFISILVAYWLDIKPYDLVNGKPSHRKSMVDKILSLRNSGLSERAIANQLGISKTCVHKWLKKAK